MSWRGTASTFIREVIEHPHEVPALPMWNFPGSLDSSARGRRTRQ